MTLSAGSCIRVATVRGQSIHVLVSDPDRNNDGLFVPLEHFDTYHSDPTVVVASGHDWIRTPMAADFPNATVWSVSQVESALSNPQSGVTRPAKQVLCSDDLLLKLRHGLFQSTQVTQKVRSYARTVLGDDFLTRLPEEADPYWTN